MRIKLAPDYRNYKIDGQTDRQTESGIFMSYYSGIRDFAINNSELRTGHLTDSDSGNRTLSRGHLHVQ